MTRMTRIKVEQNFIRVIRAIRGYPVFGTRRFEARGEMEQEHAEIAEK